MRDAGFYKLTDGIEAALISSARNATPLRQFVAQGRAYSLTR